ncbi:MAG: MBL fold metallo-hydrolase, partial [Thermoprotei archaeon]
MSSQLVNISTSGAIEIGGVVSCDGPSNLGTLFVSHAHTDHLGGVRSQVKAGRTVYATAPTLDLATHVLRLKKTENLVQLDYGKPVELSDTTITAMPANHILGAAQLLVEHRQGTVVYTGDFKQPNTPILSCDTLVIESTYGAPIYRRTDGEAEVALVDIVEKSLRKGPVTVHAYAAKVQEAMNVLAGFVDADFILDDACFGVAEIYRKHGAKLPRYRSESLQTDLKDS